LELFGKMALASLTGNLVALLVTAGLFLLGAHVVLRKLRPYLDALRQVRPVMTEAEATQTQAAPVTPPTVPMWEAVSCDTGSAQKFDLGPTYAEEMRSREEALRQQEAAVLQQIFEENLVLRDRIGELGAAEKAPSLALTACDEGTSLVLQGPADTLQLALQADDPA
jgi:hypothetical protein